MTYRDFIADLSGQLRITPAHSLKIVRTAPHRYRHYQIDKRNGGRRDIYHPTPELKAIQRWLVAEHFKRLPVSSCVAAYEDGCSVREHAQRHVRSNYFTKLDFSDFFPSIREGWIKRFLGESELGMDSETIDAVARLCCRWNGAEQPLALSIGAPSSPTLSNRILFELDSALEASARESGSVYSRYADDIYFSSRQRDVLGSLESSARHLISSLAPDLRLNETKTIRTSRKRRVVVTGLVVTSEHKVSLGRDKKREIRSRVFLWSCGRLDVDLIPELRGWLNYVADAEPSFISSLQRKFGADLVTRLATGP